MAAAIQIHQSMHAAPSLVLPAGATDCHTHVFGPVARYPYAEDRAYTPADASLEDMQRLHRHLGIERVVIVQPSPYGIDNRATLNAARQLGTRARVVAVIPATIDAAELERLDDAGVRGVRLNLATLGVSDPETIWSVIAALAPKLTDHGWHLQLFTSLEVIKSLAERLSRLDTTLVFDHFGGALAAKGAGQSGFRDLTGMMRTGQAYVKLSASYRVTARAQHDHDDVDALAETLIQANPDRVLWGSDWPHPGGHRDGRNVALVQPFQTVDNGRALDRLARWARTDDRLERILVRNPARLYGF
jgi:predicted TIM-barrel fold metal-dependent hydrolase